MQLVKFINLYLEIFILVMKCLTASRKVLEREFVIRLSFVAWNQEGNQLVWGGVSSSTPGESRDVEKAMGEAHL